MVEEQVEVEMMQQTPKPAAQLPSDEPLFEEHSELVRQVSSGFRGDVGVVPRQFLREFVNQMDLVQEEPDYVPAEQYGFQLDTSCLTPAEQEKLQAGGLAKPVSDDAAASDPPPHEEVW